MGICLSKKNIKDNIKEYSISEESPLSYMEELTFKKKYNKKINNDIIRNIFREEYEKRVK